MGYRCPVCEEPQADDTHLANHLAFTAILRGGAHESWLDEQVPGWGEMGETELAPRVTECAGSAEYPAVLADTTTRAGDEHGDDDGHRQEEHRGVDRSEVAETPLGAGIDEEAREAIEQAREMTRRRRANASKDRSETDEQSPGDGDGDSRETEPGDSPEFEGDSGSGGKQ